MLNRAIAILLVFVLAIILGSDNELQAASYSPQALAGTDVRDQISQIKPGTPIAIRFTDGSKARGYLSQVEADGFTFRIGNPTTGDQHRATFDAVKSVKVIKRTHTPVVAWIATGVVAGVAIAALVVYLIFRHNEGG